MGKHVLTDEGRKYLKYGLPEKNLISGLKKQTPIQEAKKQTDNFGIALNWAKNKGWIKIEKGLIVPLKKPASFPEEDALKKIHEGLETDKRMLEVLVKRNLVKEEKEDIFKKAEKQISEEIRTLTPELIKTGYWKKIKLKPYNVEATGKKIHFGKKHPYNAFISSVKKRLVELGFKEMEGHIIETEFWNFDALYQAQNHPARDWTQTYSLKHPKTGSLPAQKIVSNVKASHETGWETGSTGWGYIWDPNKAIRLMPRAHATASSARQLASGVEIPGKYFIISRCFRPDVIDATHGIEFNHCEGIVIDPSLTFRHLLGLLKEFAIEFAGAKQVKFIPDYYPFVEPGVQLSAQHPDLGWIELGGAGIFRPELTQPLGVKEPVIAWGLGIDRLAMLKLGIKDIRELYTRNLDWLRRF